MRAKFEGYIESRDSKKILELEAAINFFRHNIFGRTDFLRQELELWALMDVQLGAESKRRKTGELAYDRHAGYTLFYMIDVSFDKSKYDEAMRDLKRLIEIIESYRIVELAKKWLELDKKRRRSLE